MCTCVEIWLWGCFLEEERTGNAEGIGGGIIGCGGILILEYGVEADHHASEQQIKPVQKQTRAGQRTRFKAIVVIGDSEGHVGLGIKTSKEVATAIRAAIIIAKLSVLPIRRGYWGANLGEPHSLPTKESGKCGSVTVRVSSTVSPSQHLYQLHLHRTSTTHILPQHAAHPRSTGYRSRRLARRQASPPTCRCARRLHLIRRLHQDARKHPQGHLRRRR